MKVKCNACKGSGLTKSWTTKPNEARICPTCSGNGYHEINFELFEEKELLDGIDVVIITSPNSKTLETVPYLEWLTQNNDK